MFRSLSGDDIFNAFTFSKLIELGREAQKFDNVDKLENSKIHGFIQGVSKKYKHYEILVYVHTWYTGVI